MKALLTFLVQVLILAGLVVAAIYWLDLEPELIKVVVFITAGVVAFVLLLAVVPKLFSGLRRLRQTSSASSLGREKKARKLRAKGYRGRLRSVFNTVMSGEGQRFYYREKYGRPWWFVVGARGSGKSTWLQENLRAAEIVPPNDDQAIRFYVTERVVFVEVTVGEATSSHFEEEFSILAKRLERLRPVAPIAGAVCVSRWNATGCDASSVQKICKQLRVDVPIYFVLSQMHEVEGFTSVLRDTPAEALVDWSNLEGQRNSDGNLLKAVKQRVLSSLAHLGLRGVAPQGFQFLNAFVQCQKNAWALADGFRPLKVQAIIYSAGQGILVADSPAFQLHLVRDGSQSRRSKAYFRMKGSRHRFGALITIITSGFLAWGAVRESREYHDLLSQTADSLQSLSSDNETLADYEHFTAFLPIIRGWRTGGAHSRRSLGLFNAEMVEATVSRRYIEAMCQDVFQHLVADAERELYRFVEGGGSYDSQELLRFYLLLTKSKKDPTPSPWLAGEAEWIEKVLARRWFEVFRRGNTDTPDEVQRTVHLYGEIMREQEYTTGESEAICRGGGLVRIVERNEELVSDARLKISKARKSNYNLKEMVRAINKSEARPVEVVVGFKSIHGKREVTAAFTKAGWQQMESLLNDSGPSGSTPPWLLDGSSDLNQREVDCKYIRERYMKVYVETWRDVVSSIRFVDSKSAQLEDVRSIYDEIVNEVPLQKVFSKVNEHTSGLRSLTCPEGVYSGVPLELLSFVEALFRSIKRLLGGVLDEPRADNKVVATFRGLNTFTQANAEGESRLVDYHTWIRTLRDGVADAVNTENSEYRQLDVDLEKTEKELKATLGEQEWRGWKNELGAVLFPPLDVLRGIVDKKPPTLRTASWCTRVVLPTQQLVKHYPFNKKSPRQASLKDIRRVFHPVDGEIAQFRREFLSGETSESTTLSSGATEFMARAHDLGVLLFPGADDTSRFEVTFRCSPNISPVEFTVGEQSFSYACNSVDRFSGLWPDGENASLSYGFRQEGKQAQGRFEGYNDFAMFKLFEQATVIREGFSASATFDLENLGELPVRLKFESVDDRGRRGALLFGFDATSSRFLDPFRQEILQTPPTRLYRGVEPRRKCE